MRRLLVAMLASLVLAPSTRTHAQSFCAVSGTPTDAPPYGATFISAGVGRDVLLRETGPWSISLRAGTWVPLLADAPSGAQIALPSALPVRRATIPPSTRGTRRQPTVESAWDGPRRDTLTTDVDPLARYVSVRASANDGAPMWPSPSGARVHVIGHTARDRIVEVEYHGIVVRGFADREGPLYLTPHDVSATNVAIPVTAHSIARRLHGRAVVLPAGTPLYATPLSVQPVATLRTRAVGLEPLFEAPVTQCTAGPAVSCVREPSEPRGPANWVVELAGVQFTAWVRIPAETLTEHVGPTDRTLRDPPSPPSDWPRGG